MPNTYTLIASSTLTSPAASIDFTSIPATFTDLLVMVYRRSTSNVLDDAIRFNNDSSSVYSFTQMQSGASSGGVGTARNANGSGSRAGGQEPNIYTANTFNSSSIYIPNYLSSNFKQFIADGANENKSTTNYAWFHAGLWRNTAAINRITLLQEPGGTMETGTSATLYGIKNTF
jgi:hypothetical protein